jgi:hypothetical protein
MELFIDRLFQICVSALLEYLDKDEFVGTLEVEVRVFADYFVGVVFGYDLVVLGRGGR